MRTLSSGFFVATQKRDDFCWRYFVNEQRYWNLLGVKRVCQFNEISTINHRIYPTTSQRSLRFKKQKQIEWASWWLNQPIWKIWYSQIGNHFPYSRDENKKYLSCHHPGIYISCVRLSGVAGGAASRKKWVVYSGRIWEKSRKTHLTGFPSNHPGLPFCFVEQTNCEAFHHCCR